MATNIEQSPFFQQRRAKGEIVVKGKLPVSRLKTPLTLLEPPKFDLESYISNYDGECAIEILK
jgi:COP9 signalosome complex subunit 1